MIANQVSGPNKIHPVIPLTFAPAEDRMLIIKSHDVTIAARFTETDFHGAT